MSQAGENSDKGTERTRGLEPNGPRASQWSCVNLLWDPIRGSRDLTSKPQSQYWAIDPSDVSASYLTSGELI